MEFTSLIKRDRIKNTFEQIDNAINQLKEFDINGYLVFDTIKNDLAPLQAAIKYFLYTI